MGHEELIKALEDEALEQRAGLLGEAREFSLGASENARLEAMRKRDEMTSLLKAEIEERRVAMLAAESSRCQGLLLEARHELVEEVIGLALERLRRPADYGAMLRAFYEELKAEWENDGMGAFRPLASPDDLKFLIDLQPEFAGDPGVSGGVVFVSEDGRVRYEATLSSRMGKARKRLVPMVARMLFEG